MLAQNFAGGGAGNVHGDVAAADDEDVATNGELVSEIDVEEEIDTAMNAIEVNAGDGEIAAAVGADGQKNGVESLLAEFGDLKVTAGAVIEFQVDVASGKNLADLGFDDVAGETVLGDAEIEHAAGDGSGLEDSDGIAHEGEVVGGGEPDRAGADDSDFEGQFGFDGAGVHVDVMLGLGPITLGEKTLEGADGNGFVDLTAAAGGFAGMSANAAADTGKRVGAAGVLIRFFETALGNEADVTTCVGVRRAGHHTGEVSMEPVLIHPLF